MRTEIVLFILGAMVFLIPFLGVPTAWKDILELVIGVLVMSTAFMLRLKHRRHVRTHADTVHLEHDPHGVADVHPV